MRPDLLGGHLWTKGYYWVRIANHRQFLATLHYGRENRRQAGLVLSVPLQPSGV